MQGILPESQPVLSPVKAHARAQVLQNFRGFGPFFSLQRAENLWGSGSILLLQELEELRGNSLGLIQKVPF
jgi:hypothetical protein